MRRTAPNFTGVEGAVVNGASLPTTRFTEQNPALCGIYFINRAIRAHGAPIDKESQLAGGRRVAMGFQLGGLSFELGNLGFHLCVFSFHLSFHLREFLAYLQQNVAINRGRRTSNKRHRPTEHEQLHGSVSVRAIWKMNG
jgi:hypothetical protein